jgi:predicted ATPase/class 3 adenylate cyclase
VVRDELPRGTVTFLFTDVERSTQLLLELGPEGYAAALAEHRRLLREVFARHGGVEVDTQGDGFFVAFPTAPGALAAAQEATAGLEATRMRIRIGVHTGTPLLTPEGYVGEDVHRAARIAAAGHGGQVLVSASTAALVSDVSLRDLGEHRFKDLAASERVFQVGEAAFAPLKSLHRTNLPVPATPFLGRKHELGMVVELLARDDVRVLTLTGPGGTGKTRLALQASAEVAERFADGLWWVPLAPVRDPALVATAVAQALEVKEQPGRPLADTLAGSLAGMRALVLLDNAEHLLPAVARDIARLRDANGSTVLVTSRERLRIQGEHVFAVPSMSPRDGVALFLARAAQLGAEPAPAGAIEKLCERLDELPLALELAAARTRLFSPEQLLERLGQRLDLLRGDRDADPRQQTLRATIEWSHELLDETEQLVFRRLAVFAGGCTYDAVESVCGTGPDELQSLLDKSLVRRRDTDQGPRYWMLETIREFAVERLLASGERDARREAHARHFVAQADERDVRRFSIADPEGLAWLSSERDNLQAAVDWALETGDDALFAVAARALCSWWLLTGTAREGLRRIEAVLQRRARQPPEVVTNLVLAASDLARFTGDEARAIELFEEILDRVHDNDLLRATINADLSEILIRQGNLDEAEAHLRESLALGGGARATASFAELALARGDYEAAETLARDANAGFQGVHAYNVVATQEILGEAARRRGRLEQARSWFALAARGACELGDKGLTADCLDGLAAAEAGVGRDAEADRIAAIAAALRDAAGVIPYRPERVRPVGLVPYGISLDEAVEQTVGPMPDSTGRP